MLGTLAAAALTIACAAIVGEGLATLLRRRGAGEGIVGRGWAPAAGLALILCVAIATVKLPGHGTTGAIAVALLTALAAWVLFTRGEPRVPDLDALAAGAAATLAGCLPYIANGRFGIPGVTFNNDAANHLAWMSALQDPGLIGAAEPTAGYPVGPHSLMVSISSGTGMGLDLAFAGVLLALPAIVALAALPLLDGLTRPRRALAALLISSAYLVAAFYAQAGFKELLTTAFLLALVGVVRDVARGRLTATPVTGLLLGLLLAGIVVAISYGGLVWAFGALAVWAVAATGAALLAGRGPRSLLRDARGAISLRRGPIALAAGAAIAGIVLLAADLPRLIDSLSLFGSSPAGAGSIETGAVGHLAGPLSKYELFGFWPLADFRFRIAETWRNGALLGLAIGAAAFGAVWWARRRDLLVPSAWVAALAILLYLDQTESPYVASKSFPIAGTFTMLVAVRALLERWPQRIDLPELRMARLVAVVLFVGGALYSSYLVLEGGRVGVPAHARDLDALRKTVEGRPTTFLGVDDFIRWELRGVPLVGFAEGGKPFAYGTALDFDSGSAADFDRAAYVIAPRSSFGSEPPPNFRRAETAGDYVLWRRAGSTPTRQVLAEGSAPGAVLNCSTEPGAALARKPGWARVWSRAPVVPRLPARIRVMPVGGEASMRLRLPRGRWELSLAYVSPQAVDIDAGGQRVEAPANLDRPGPWWAIGSVESGGGATRATFAVERGPLHSPNQIAEIVGLAAVPANLRRELVPLSEACGRYVDWYVTGKQRPQP